MTYEQFLERAAEFKFRGKTLSVEAIDILAKYLYTHKLENRFFYNLLSNRLFETVMTPWKHDDLEVIVAFIYLNFPKESYGNDLKTWSWIRKHGLKNVK